ncbi:MAG: putative Holliday junction resolvase [candidate division WS6 bacterium OLB20]|uniref:Putative pre-16S rRNA nuclease n=1 Tax=candidate division WS6 bacterium OLB20 TaxID=1617426 RepID=A0A136LVY3_9BACT|nr:MAG: putative Holliday junction resolvase [candidate division WS6 bacterium OLB20]
MKYLGIDYGDSKTGVAVSDDGGSFAAPLTVIRTKNRSVLLKRLQELAEEHSAVAFVLGLPGGYGGDSPQTKIVRQFGEELSSLGQVHYWDETYSTLRAETGARGRKRKNADSEAARIILQEFLDATET